MRILRLSLWESSRRSRVRGGVIATICPLRRLRRHLSQRARLLISPIITQIGRESKFSAEILSVCHFSAKNTPRTAGLYFLSISKAMAYHHALACISSALTSISRQSEYIINRRLYRFRNDDIQHFVLVIYNAFHTSFFYYLKNSRLSLQPQTLML